MSQSLTLMRVELSLQDDTKLLPSFGVDKMITGTIQSRAVLFLLGLQRFELGISTMCGLAIPEEL